MYRLLCEPTHPREMNAGVQFLGNTVIACLTSKKWPNCLPEWLNRSAFPQQGMGGPVPPVPQHLLLPLVCILALLTHVAWYFIPVLTCISLMPNDVGYLFRCLFSIYISSLVKYLFPHLYIIGLVPAWIAEKRESWLTQHAFPSLPRMPDLMCGLKGP